ncbi:hypothetical protein RFI_33526, partial [Reticulomyxa filosa]
EYIKALKDLFDVAGPEMEFRPFQTFLELLGCPYDHNTALTVFRTLDSHASGIIHFQQFINWSDVPEAILGDFHQFDFDDKQECKLCLSHKQTTEEIQCLLKDLRVLGKSDFRKLLRWRLKMKKFLEQVMPKDEKSQDDKDKADADAKEGLKLVCFCYYNTYMYIHIYLYIYMYVTFGKQMGVVVKKMKIEEELDAEEDTKIREEVRNLVEKKKKDDRKKKRKIRQAKIKSTRLMLMGGIKPDDVWDFEDERQGLFRLDAFRNKEELNA